VRGEGKSQGRTILPKKDFAPHETEKGSGQEIKKKKKKKKRK